MSGRTPIEEYWQDPNSPKVQKYYERAAVTRVDQADARLVRSLIAPAFSGKRVLDFGAGPGRMVPIWSSAGVKLTSCDFSPPFFEVLKRVSDDHGQNSCMLDLTKELPEGKFDLVFSTQVLLHIPPAKILTLLRNVASAALGPLIFVTWQDEPPYDTEASDKIQSFNHDYRTLFPEAGLALQVEMDLHYSDKKATKNKVFIVERA